MKLYFSGLILCALCLLFGHTCVAQTLDSRPIVYSARYYLPPGSKGTSHYHIYRINSDGSSKEQITFGSHDDYDPQLSPDNRWLTFLRNEYIDRSDPNQAQYLLDLKTCRLQKIDVDWHRFSSGPTWQAHPLRLEFFDDHHKAEQVFAILPYSMKSHVKPFDGHLSSTSWSSDSNTDDFIDDNALRHSWSISAIVPGMWTHELWIDSTTIAALRSTSDDPDKSYLYLFRVRYGELTLVSSHPILIPLKLAPENDFGSPIGEALIDDLIRWPNHPGHVVLQVVEEQLSSGHSWAYIDFDLANGHMRSLADNVSGFFFSPDGKRFATIALREVVPYSHWSDGSIRTVWAQPMRIGDPKTGKTWMVTQSNTNVENVDWGH